MCTDIDVCALSSDSFYVFRGLIETSFVLKHTPPMACNSMIKDVPDAGNEIPWKLMIMC